MENIDNKPEFQDDFSPFNENVIERDYTRPNVQGVIDANPIDEPVIIPPTFEDLNATFQEKAGEEFSDEGGATSGRATWGERPVANESMNELDGKEKKQAASAMVEAVLDGYSQLTLFANKLVQIPEKKINKKINEGVINPNVQIPVNNTTLPVRDFLKVYNQEIGSVLTVDDEFKDKVRPVMQRVFMKRNIGMTDEQLLGYYFGVDIITKGAIVVQIRNQNNTLIQSIEELSASYSGGASTRYEEPQTKQEPQQEPTREYAEPTSTREYAEPEERKSTQSEYAEVEVVEEKKATPRKTAMPEFGNADILAEMEEIAKGEKPKRGRAKKMREAQLGVAVGKKGVGKSFTTNKMIETYVRGNMGAGILPRKALILDVNDEFSHIKGIALKDLVRFSVHPIVEARRVRPFHENGKRMTLDEIAHTLFVILETYRGGLLLIEDINRYISDNLPNDIIGAICTNRHTSLDIIMHFQSIGRISPKIWQNMNWIRFHKNLDSVGKHKNKFEDKYELLRLVEIIVNEEYQGGNKRFYQFVNMDEMQFMGKIDPKKLEFASRQYIEENYRKTISPMLQLRDAKGKPRYTSETAIKSEIERIKKTYT